MDPKEQEANQTEQAVDSEQESSTLDAVDAKLAEMRGEVADDNDTESVDDTEQIADDEKQGDAESDDSDEKESDDSPMLPSGHRRSALARGYTNEEIDHYLETKPDEATARFAKVHDDWVDENSRWSTRGRQLMEADKGESKEDKKDESPEALSHYNVDALVDEHGNEDLLKALVAPLNTMIDRVNGVVERLGNSENFLQESEQQTLTTMIQDFLTSSEMKPYETTYGKAWADLTDEQTKSRLKLSKEADIIVVGARECGENITVQDALDRAHIILSQGTRDDAIRQGIRDSIKKRTKTTKSSHEQLPASDNAQPITEAELEERTEVRLRALRNKK